MLKVSEGWLLNKTKADWSGHTGPTHTQRTDQHQAVVLFLYFFYHFTLQHLIQLSVLPLLQLNTLLSFSHAYACTRTLFNSSPKKPKLFSFC